MTDLEANRTLRDWADDTGGTFSLYGWEGHYTVVLLGGELRVESTRNTKLRAVQAAVMEWDRVQRKEP